jgi:hypothetical protein
MRSQHAFYPLADLAPFAPDVSIYAGKVLALFDARDTAPAGQCGFFVAPARHSGSAALARRRRRRWMILADPARAATEDDDRLYYGNE